MSALQWIVKEAKKIRREFPRRFQTWREYVAQASAIYAKKHKGKSPVGRKRKKKRVGALVLRNKTIVSGVRTSSRTHTDKNRITANIQVGRRRARRKKVTGVKRYKSKDRAGEHPPPIAWHVVKLHDLGFEKKGSQYFTISSSFPRRIVWQDWEARAAKEYLKKHCIKSK